MRGNDPEGKQEGGNQEASSATDKQLLQSWKAGILDESKEEDKSTMATGYSSPSLLTMEKIGESSFSEDISIADESMCSEINKYAKWPEAPCFSELLAGDFMDDIPEGRLVGYGVTPAFDPRDYNRSNFMFCFTFTSLVPRRGRLGKKLKSRDFLAKVIPPYLNGENKTYREEAFRREVALYGTTFPMMMALLRDVGCDQRQFFPNMIPVSAPNSLVLQDMRVLGFSAKPSYLMLDGKHSTATVVALGRFHAAAVALHHRCPDAVERFCETEFVVSRRDELVASVEENILAMAEESVKWRGCAEYHARFLRLGHRIVTWLLGYFKYGKGHFHALIHGELWTNNILFSYKKGEVDHVCFVDYQKTRWAPAILDFLYFLFTSVDDIMYSKEHWRDLLTKYEESLRFNLKKMNLEDLAPSMDQLVYDLRTSAPYAAYVACVVLPVALDYRAERWIPAIPQKVPFEKINENHPHCFPKSPPSLEVQSPQSRDERIEELSSDPVWSAIRRPLFRQIFPRVLNVLDDIGGI